MTFATGEQLCEHVRARGCPNVVLGFSNGKDSVGTWLQLRRFFDGIVPYYRYVVPGLQIVEESLAYYERFFGVRIRRYPDPSFLGQLEHQMLQTPASRRYWERKRWPWSYRSEDYVEECQDLAGPGSWMGYGWRASDSFRRRMVIMKYGPLKEENRSFMPIFDWTETRLEREFIAAGVKLPVDYALFNRSFEALTYRFLKDLRRVYPGDWAKCCTCETSR